MGNIYDMAVRFVEFTYTVFESIFFGGLAIGFWFCLFMTIFIGVDMLSKKIKKYQQSKHHHVD